MKKHLLLPLLIAIAKVVTTRDAFDNIGTSREDVVGTVVSARDALEI